MLAHLLRAVLNDRLGHYVAELPRYFRDRLLPGKRVKLLSHGGQSYRLGMLQEDRFSNTCHKGCALEVPVCASTSGS